MFNSLTGVLTKEASKVFKFEQQEKLHEDIIDKGLAKIAEARKRLALINKAATNRVVDKIFRSRVLVCA